MPTKNDIKIQVIVVLLVLIAFGEVLFYGFIYPQMMNALSDFWVTMGLACNFINFILLIILIFTLKKRI